MTEDRPQVPSGIDIHTALANPSAYFAQPRDVLAYPGISDVLKPKLLHQWDHDARLLAEAEGEGMGGGEESMLGRVHQTLRQLEATIDRMESSAVGSGGEESATKVQHAAARTQERTTELRAPTRARPITGALLMFGFGYLIGRIGSRKR